MESTENRYKYIFDEILTLTDDGFVVVPKCILRR